MVNSSVTSFLWKFVQGVRDLRVQQGNLVSTALPLTTRRNVPCGIDICIFELEDDAQVEELCNFLESEADNIAAVWIAPSCGTASKARERRLPELQRLGIEIPIPLRSLEKPDQIDGLGETNKLKVEKANMLYFAVEKIATTACNNNIFYWH